MKKVDKAELIRAARIAKGSTSEFWDKVSAELERLQPAVEPRKVK